MYVLVWFLFEDNFLSFPSQSVDFYIEFCSFCMQYRPAILIRFTICFKHVQTQTSGTRSVPRLLPCELSQKPATQCLSRYPFPDWAIYLLITFPLQDGYPALVLSACYGHNNVVQELLLAKERPNVLAKVNLARLSPLYPALILHISTFCFAGLFIILGSIPTCIYLWESYEFLVMSTQSRVLLCMMW